jgi:hypothetical protein
MTKTVNFSALWHPAAAVTLRGQDKKLGLVSENRRVRTS